MNIATLRSISSDPPHPRSHTAMAPAFMAASDVMVPHLPVADVHAHLPAARADDVMALLSVRCMGGVLGVCGHVCFLRHESNLRLVWM